MTTSAKIVFLRTGNNVSEQIDVENLDCPMVYVHANGYPEGILPMLSEYLKTDGAKSRKHDADYLSAYYLAYLIIKNEGAELEELSDYRGFGITTASSYVDYHYCVENKDGKFQIIICDSFGGVIETITL